MSDDTSKKDSQKDTQPAPPAQPSRPAKTDVFGLSEPGGSRDM